MDLLLLIILIGTMTGVQALIYKDFKDFDPVEKLNFGVLHTGVHGEWLTSYVNDKCPSRFNKFLVHLRNEYEIASFLEIHDKLPDGLQIFPQLYQVNPDWFPFLKEKIGQAILSNSFKGFQVYTVITDDSIGTFDFANVNKGVIPALQIAQSMGIQLGITILYENYVNLASEILTFLKKRGVQLNEFNLKIVIKEKNFFDYNSFSKFMNGKYRRAMNAASDFSPHLTLQLEFDQQKLMDDYKINVDQLNRYKSLLAKFLYRWGEEELVSVMLTDLVTDESDRCKAFENWEKFIFEWPLSREKTMVAALNENNKEEWLNLHTDPEKSALVCQDFHQFYTPSSGGNHEFGNLTKCDTSEPDLKFLQLDHFKLFQMVHQLATTLNSILESVKGTPVLIPQNTWQGKNDSLDVIPRILNDFYLRTNRTDEVQLYIEGYREINGIAKGSDCYGFKTYWNTLRNWVLIHGYRVISTGPLFGGNNAWFKNISMGQHRNVIVLLQQTSDGRAFLSNLQDKCVIIDDQVPSKPTKFNLKFVGVTFYLLKDYANLEPKRMALLFQLIHFQFRSIEISLGDSPPREYINILQLAFTLAENDTAPTLNTSRSKYFLNLGEKSSGEIVSIVKGFNTSGRYFERGHITYSTNTEEMIIRINLLKQVATKVGISVKYEDVYDLQLNNQMNRNIFALVNYLTIEINLFETIANSLQMSPLQYLNSQENVPKFYDIFVNLRAQRYLIHQLYPNLTVYARIAWPTVSETNSIETFLRVWSYVNEFATEFNFPIFMNGAFDKAENGYGWWKLNNTREISNPLNYIDKQAEFYGLKTQRPSFQEDEFVSERNTQELPLTELIIGTLALALVIIFGTAALIYRYFKIQSEIILTKNEIYEFKRGKKNSDKTANASDSDFLIHAKGYDMDKYEVRKEEIDIASSTPIGSGNFGSVYKIHMPRFGKMVAIKKPKVHGKQELLTLMREIKVMSYVGDHENILTLLGAYTKEIERGVVFVVTEFAENGSLLEYLRSLRNIENFNDTQSNINELYQFCEEISKGMDYLSQKKVVHGDLSTRNVLLDELKICKICDFGLSKKLYDVDLYIESSGQPIPWKWMAVETLQLSEFSLKSDVWSLGVTFWEIFSLGEEPYQGFAFDLEFSKKLMDGLRLPKPEMLHDTLYEEILNCWKILPNERCDPLHFVKLFRSQTSTSDT